MAPSEIFGTGASETQTTLYWESLRGAQEQSYDIAHQKLDRLRTDLINDRRGITPAYAERRNKSLDWNYGRINQAQGFYVDARSNYKQCLGYFKTTGNDTKIYYPTIMLAMLLTNRGDFEQASKYLGQAQELAAKFDKSPETPDFQRLMFKYYEGYYWLYQGEYDRAIKCYEEVERSRRARCFTFAYDPLSRNDDAWQHSIFSQTNLGVAYFHAGDYGKAEQYFKSPLPSNCASFISAKIHRSIALSYLGRIAERRGELEQARKNHEEACAEISPNKNDDGNRHRVERANALTARGAFHVRHQEWDAAAFDFAYAEQLRIDTGTEHHPDYADTLCGMATLALAQNRLTSATEHVDHALTILDAALEPRHARMAAPLVARQALQLLQDHPDANQMKTDQTRLAAILQKPLGPWKLDFLDTVQYYEAALTEAGKTDAAAALDKLYVEQKDKR